MTSFRRTPARPGPRRQDISPLAPDPRPADKDQPKRPNRTTCRSPRTAGRPAAPST